MTSTRARKGKPGHSQGAAYGLPRQFPTLPVAACGVVVRLELGELSLKIVGIPEQHLVDEFSAHRPDLAFHEWWDSHVHHGLNFVDLQNPKVGHPPVGLARSERPSRMA